MDAANDTIGDLCSREAANPESKRKPLINWTELNKKHGVTMQKSDHTQNAPYEKDQWIIRQVSKSGRTKEVATAAWQNYEGIAIVKRDHLGFNSLLRLWLPKGQFEDVAKINFIEGSVVQGSDRKKSPKAECVESLRMHAHDMFGSHGITSGHAFFRGQLGAASSDAKAQVQHGQPQEGGDDESADETPKKSRHELAPQKRDRVSVAQLEDSEDELENPIRGGGASSRKKKRKVNVADATVSLYEAVGSSLCEHRLGLSSRQRRGTAPCVVSHVRASRSLGPLALATAQAPVYQTLSQRWGKGRH